MKKSKLIAFFTLTTLSLNSFALTAAAHPAQTDVSRISQNAYTVKALSASFSDLLRHGKPGDTAAGIFALGMGTIVFTTMIAAPYLAITLDSTMGVAEAAYKARYAIGTTGIGAAIMAVAVVMHVKPAAAASMTDQFLGSPEGFQRFLALSVEDQMIYAQTEPKLAEALERLAKGMKLAVEAHAKSSNLESRNSVQEQDDESPSANSAQ